MKIPAETPEVVLRKVEECMKYAIANEDKSVKECMQICNIRSSCTFYKYVNIIKETNPELYNNFYANRKSKEKGRHKKATAMKAKKFCQYVIDNNTTVADATRALNISSSSARRFLDIIKNTNNDLYRAVVNDHIDKRRDTVYITRQKLDMAEFILTNPEYKTIGSIISKFKLSYQTVYNYIDSLQDIDIELYNKVREKVRVTGYEALCEANRSKCRKEN